MALAVHTLKQGVHTDSDRIVLLHGFTQNARCWGSFANLLGEATGCEIVAIDAPGHGNSPIEHDTADLWESASLIAEAGGDAHYVGYSMGGRMAIHLALAHPELLRSLTLIGATAGIEDDNDRTARHYADVALASRLKAIGLPAFLDEWLALPLFNGLNAESSCRSARLTNRVNGLAESLVASSTGAQENLWPRIPEIHVPMLAIAGETDAKFVAIAQRLSHSPVIIDGAGHSAQWEQPEATAHAVADFINLRRRPS